MGQHIYRECLSRVCRSLETIQQYEKDHKLELNENCFAWECADSYSISKTKDDDDDDDDDDDELELFN